MLMYNTLIYFLTEKSDLTVDALKLHNELQAGSLERKKDGLEDAMEDTAALTERTSGTFLSGLSDCSNLTFRKVQRYWESNSAAHKEVSFRNSQNFYYYYFESNPSISSLVHVCVLL